jgi:hypothetical protein
MMAFGPASRARTPSIGIPARRGLGDASAGLPSCPGTVIPARGLSRTSRRLPLAGQPLRFCNLCWGHFRGDDVPITCCVFLPPPGSRERTPRAGDVEHEPNRTVLRPDRSITTQEPLARGEPGRLGLIPPHASQEGWHPAAPAPHPPRIAPPGPPAAAVHPNPPAIAVARPHPVVPHVAAPAPRPMVPHVAAPAPHPVALALLRRCRHAQPRFPHAQRR